MRPPCAEDGPAVTALISDCPPLDPNSAYCNLLQCTHFAETCVVAERNDQIVGWISGHLPPLDPSRFFVWQVAVHREARGEGLAGRMLEELLARPAAQSATYLVSTITQDNDASWALFGGFARRRGVQLVRTPYFERDAHFAGAHDTEWQAEIGPLSRKGLEAKQKFKSKGATPKPSSARPDRAIYERRESQVRSYSRSMPREFTTAQGEWMHDGNGGRYLDFLSGCSSLNYGHNHPVLKRALLDYIGKDGITHGLDLHTEAKAEFLDSLETEILKPRGLDYRAMFTGPTGTNAVEAAIKLARKVTGREMVIAFTNGFHGMTLGALACTGNAEKRGGAGVPLNHVSHEPYDGYYGADVDTADLLEQRLSDPSSGLDAPAAIMVETVQGEGGLNAASPEWLRRIATIAKAHGALLIIDDIQAGCGRTGGFFSFEDMGFTPDIVTLAKSLSGMGLPFALTLFRPELDIWSPGEHNGTFRGNNHAFVTAAAALRNFWSDGQFVAGIKRRGDYLRDRLDRMAKEHKFSTRGRGMMRGIDVGSGEIASRITAAAFNRGLIIETSGAHDEIVKVLAPLTIDEAVFAQGLDILEECVSEVLSPAYSVAAE